MTYPVSKSSTILEISENAQTQFLFAPNIIRRNGTVGYGFKQGDSRIIIES